MRNLEDDIAHILIDQETLSTRVKWLAKQIADDYRDEDSLVLISVLKGSVIFMTEFSMALQRPHEIDFMSVSSYVGSKSSGVVQLYLDLRQEIEGKNILILEDIVDSGRTLNMLRKLLLERKPASLKICTLLNKPSVREIDVPLDYIGFDIPDEFVVGYGLDFNELYRNLPFIGVLKPEVIAWG